MPAPPPVKLMASLQTDSATYKTAQNTHTSHVANNPISYISISHILITQHTVTYTYTQHTVALHKHSSLQIQITHTHAGTHQTYNQNSSIISKRRKIISYAEQRLPNTSERDVLDWDPFSPLSWRCGGGSVCSIRTWLAICQRNLAVRRAHSQISCFP